MKKILLTGLLAAIIIAGAAIEADEFPDNPGLYKKTLRLKNSSTLRYTLFIPRNFSPQRMSPLVMALHYKGKMIPFFSWGFMRVLVEPGLKGLNAIIVAPDCPVRSWATQQAETAVLQLMDHIKKNYRINKKKVLLTGFSLGGIGTWYLASRHPYLFSSALPMASSMGETTLKLVKDIPFYVIHSDADEIFPLMPFKKKMELLINRGISIKVVIQKDIGHYETDKYVKPLRQAIPWIKKTWKKKK